MRIDKNDIDELNAVVTVTVQKEDYTFKVDNTLKNYRKKVNIPGFRKGMVPLGMIKKQYEKAVIFEEVNQILQDSLNKFLIEEKIAILGNPLPKPQDDLDWEADELRFDFELGLEPSFDLDIKSTDVSRYKVTVSEEEIDNYIDNFSKRYGEQKEVEEVGEESVSKVQPSHPALSEPQAFFLKTDEFKDSSLVLGKTVGDFIEEPPKDLFEEEESLKRLLNINTEENNIWESEEKLKLEWVVINELDPAPIDQALFDKIYGENVVEGEEAFREKVREESEKMYESETDRHFLNTIMESLLEKTKIELPEEFLLKWIIQTNDGIDDQAKAKEQFASMQDGLCYQLIQTKLATKFDVRVEEEDIRATAMEHIQRQFSAYGQISSDESFLQEMVSKTLENKEQREQIINQSFSNKLLSVFKEEIDAPVEEVNFDKFVEIVTKKNEASKVNQE